MNLRQAHTNHAYCWPATLLRGTDAEIVYLDLNHWINLAKTLSGHPDGRRHQEILNQLLQTVERGGAVFPISVSIYTEVLKIRDRRRRSDIRKVIEHLGRFAIVTNRHVIATHEIEALLNRLVGPNPNPINTMHYLDWGIFRAMGLRGNLKVLNQEGDDDTFAARQRFRGGPKEFDRLVNEHLVKLNRQVLDGPDPEDEADFKAQGYRPDRVLEGYSEEANAEGAWARLLDQYPHWRKGRLRDAVSVREIAYNINSIVKEAADARNVEAFEDLISGAENPRRAFDAMPSFDVAVTLKTAIHRNANHRWTNNDIHDIHALAGTLPYCDIVVTDREMAGYAERSKLNTRLGTTVLSNLEELARLL